jgi:hypothetical protein
MFPAFQTENLAGAGVGAEGQQKEFTTQRKRVAHRAKILLFSKPRWLSVEIQGLMEA